jgi:hypothetical protein
LNPRYVGPFEIVGKIGPVAYRLNSPMELDGVYNVFHVSNLKKCLSDESLMFPMVELQIGDHLHLVDEPVEIMGRKEKNLKHIKIPKVKVCWNSNRGPEFTWDLRIE